MPDSPVATHEDEFDVNNFGEFILHSDDVSDEPKQEFTFDDYLRALNLSLRIPQHEI